MKTYHTERRIQFHEGSIASALSEIADVLATLNEEDCTSVRIDLEDRIRTYSGETVSRIFQVEMVLQKSEERR